MRTSPAVSLLVALSLGCGGITESGISSVHGTYILADTLAGHSWHSVVGGQLVLRDDQTFEMSIPSSGGATVTTTGDWEIVNKSQILLASTHAYTLQFVTADMGLSDGSQIVVSDAGAYFNIQTSAAYSFRRQ